MYTDPELFMLDITARGHYNVNDNMPLLASGPFGNEYLERDVRVRRRRRRIYWGPALSRGRIFLFSSLVDGVKLIKRDSNNEMKDGSHY